MKHILGNSTLLIVNNLQVMQIECNLINEHKQERNL